MEKCKEYQELIQRLGYLRTKKRLSARELSLRLEHSESYYFRMESGKIELSCNQLFKVLEVLETTPEELFYYDIEKYPEDKELLSLLKTMTKEDKQAVVHLLSKKK